MIPVAFKSIGLLFLVMEQTVIPFNFSGFSENTLRPHLKNKDISERQLTRKNSDKKYQKVTDKAAISQSLVIPCTESCDDFKISPTPFLYISEEKIPVIPTKRFLPTPMPLPTEYKPEPSIVMIPEVTIIPIPTIYPDCGCDPRSGKMMYINCPMYVSEVSCLDSEM